MHDSYGEYVFTYERNRARLSYALSHAREKFKSELALRPSINLLLHVVRVTTGKWQAVYKPTLPRCIVADLNHDLSAIWCKSNFLFSF